jgi:hypothetical protein
MTTEQKQTLKRIFSDAIVEARRQKLIDLSYAGKFVLNCNNGGLTEVEKMERIK